MRTSSLIISLSLALAVLSGCRDGFGTLEAQYVDASQQETNINAALPPTDEDQDGVVADKDCDDKDPKIGGHQSFYRDEDGDGYANGQNVYMACKKPEGYLPFATGVLFDCNDKDKSVFPGAPEICDGKDNDCDGQVDNSHVNKWYIDADGDGRGDPNGEVKSECKVGSTKFVANSDDCNDLDPQIYKGAPELCDGKDNDCDGKIDEDVKIPVWVDSDKDGFGDKQKQTSACKAEAGFVANSDDCNDLDPKVNPKAVEICNGIDDDCNSKTDEDVKKTWWLDFDGDGYGDNNAKVVLACDKPSGHADKVGDCNDVNVNVHPGAVETCNKLDDDCDGQTDEYDGQYATNHKVFTQDLDGDGFAAKGAESKKACEAPPNYSLVSTSGFDCNDAVKTVFEGAPELCDGLDNDCDGATDEGAAAVSCDDNNSYTIDTCAAAKCVHTELGVTFTCALPKNPTPTQSDVCSVGLFYTKNEEFGMLLVGKDKIVLKASELCPALKAGQTLHVNSMVASDSGAQWVGGEYVEVKEGQDGKLVKGTPGDVTILVPGLDFNYVLADFKICQ